jgi:Flp pilus assembly protein TadD
MAEAFREEDRLQEALALCERAIALAPQIPHFCRSKINTLIDMRRPDDAVAFARDALTRNGGRMPFVKLVGDALYLAERYHDALDVFRQVLEAEPDDADSLNTVAWILIGDCIREDRHTIAEAVALAEKAHAKAPSSVAILDTLGWAYYKAGRFDEAVRKLGEVVETEPERAEFRYRLAAALHVLGDRKTAREEYREGLALDPDDRHRAIAEAVLGVREDPPKKPEEEEEPK